MKFVSTRGRAAPLSFSGAFAAGLADDGGLFVPETLPPLSKRLLAGGEAKSKSGSNVTLTYPELAFEFLRLFDSDHSAEELRDIVERSYQSFDNPENPAPLRRLDDDVFVLELFHGPTLAFKDFGLQLVGNLFEDQIRRTGRPINVLGATSGDTGSAAIHGLAGKEGVHVFILYPKGRISELQERQMTCTGAANIFPVAIEGSFDDAQRIIKELFNDLAFKERAGLSAVNSINIARILAQSIYYIHAWNQLPEDRRDAVRFTVPTGNFGNIFAGWLAARMGLPARKFTIATNRNDILYRLFSTGAYEPRSVHASLAPSMDIQVASNFERFLYYLLDKDSVRVAEMMAAMMEKGALDIPGFDADVFTATRTTDDGIVNAIQEVHRRYQYIVDPHTACGFAGPREASGTRVMLATAHPAKFPETIEKAIGRRVTHPILEALRDKAPVRHEIPPAREAVKALIEENAA